MFRSGIRSSLLQEEHSNPRNDLLVNLFRRIGLSERIGSGGPIYFKFQINMIIGNQN